MSNRKVKTVWFHSSIPVPGIPKLQMQAGELATPGVDLELTDLGLNISKGDIQAFVPIVNIKSVVFHASKAESK